MARRAANRANRAGTQGTSTHWVDTGPAPANAQGADWRSFYRQAPPGNPDYRGPRDCLTGAPLVDGSLRYAAPDFDTRRKLHLGSPIPLGLHTRDQDGAVGKRFTPQFAKYLSEIRDELTAEQWARLSEWWAVPYVVDSLRRTLGRKAVDAVLAVTFRRDAYAEVARAYRVQLGWLTRTERALYAEARRLLYGYGAQGDLPRPKLSEREGAMAPGEVA